MLNVVNVASLGNLLGVRGGHWGLGQFSRF